MSHMPEKFEQTDEAPPSRIAQFNEAFDRLPFWALFLIFTAAFFVLLEVAFAAFGTSSIFFGRGFVEEPPVSAPASLVEGMSP